MSDEAPTLDNNVCLALLRIFKFHPDAECPIVPLLEGDLAQ
jgi:hypothetical protein